MLNKPPLLPASEAGGLTDALRTLVAVLHIDDLLPGEQIPAALQELEAELLVIGAEAFRANRRLVRIDQAARDFEGYPALAKLHTALVDMLTLGLPKELERWMRRLLSHDVQEAFEAMFRGLVSHARRDDNPIRKALCRFLLFETVRFGLVLRTKLSTDDSYGVGMTDEDVDAIAASETDLWMDDELPWTAEVESFEGIATAGFIRLEAHLEDLRESLRTVGHELRDTLDRRARLEARLVELDARDAILIRNALADEFEVQRLSLDLIRERHAVAFAEVQRGAMDTQLSRLRNQQTPRARGRTDTALIDLVREQLAEVGRMT